MTSQSFDRTADQARQTVDGEHDIQVQLIDAFVAAQADGKPAKEVQEILDRLLEYSRVHFHSEDLLMRLFSYPEYQEHQMDHAEMMELLEKMRGVEHPPAEGLRQRLIRHIKDHDHRLRRFLGSSAPAG